ncbi:amidase [Rhodoplanes sp. Z2-YC6860]|uniref:amidase n=1 Tax=Rhodoplanes sp. Z2-YC6860 TaxID=674703 RepID=UPI00078CF904|nr:amidase [Rhodoplanes sp. Z2-YC6860]AMN39386.1 amidase [Rhodoplanes sp. Z2-YC6860]
MNDLSMRSHKLRGYVSHGADLRSGKLSPKTYLEETLSKITQLDKSIGAFVTVNRDGARQAAEDSAKRWANGKPLSPIDGMPVAIKDIIETADMPTGQGSPMWEGTDWKRDSASVHALREAGAVIIGKTTTTEFASSHPWHKTQNPHDPKRTPGGSSSGSAAAVGAGMVPAGLGTQVVGSILRPASFCGAVGFKPSVGAINRSGSHDHFSQSCQGAIGATLADTWAVLRAIADRAGGDPGFVGLTGDVDFKTRTRPGKLAIVETYGWKHTSEGGRKAFAAAKQRLQTVGIELLSRADDPDIEAVDQSLSEAMDLTMSINAWEGRWPLNTYSDMDPTKLSQSARDRLLAAEKMTQKQFGELLARREAVRATWAKAAAKYDALITLGACGAAPVGLGTTGNTAMNVSASLLGCPALTIPVLADEGLPLGLQLLGRANDDAALFGVASWIAAEGLSRPDLVGTVA